MSASKQRQTLLTGLPESRCPRPSRGSPPPSGGACRWRPRRLPARAGGTPWRSEHRPGYYEDEILHLTSPSTGSATVMSNLAERPGRGRDGEDRPQPGLGRPPDEEDSKYKEGTHSCYEAACCADIIIKDLSSNG